MRISTLTRCAGLEQVGQDLQEAAGFAKAE